MSDHDADRDAIIALIHRNRIAVWTRNFPEYEKCFVHAPYATRWNASILNGVFRRQGWDDISARVRRQFDDAAMYNERNAYETTVENLILRIYGDMAWATFDQIYPNQHAEVAIATGVSHEARVFERHEGQWLIAFWGIMNATVNQLHAPILHVAPDGTVLWQSAAATPVLEADDDLIIRNGRVRFRDAKSNDKLQAAIRWAADRDRLLLPTRGAMPVLLEAGEGAPTKIYWVLAEGGLIILMLHTPGAGQDRLDIAAAIFGLSPAQKQLAGFVAEGLTLAEMAERMGITPNTARTHLDRIFEKTGVRTQPALVRVLLSTGAPV